MKHGETVKAQDFVEADKVIKAGGCRTVCALVKRDGSEWVVGYVHCAPYTKVCTYQEVSAYFNKGWERGELERYIREQIKAYERVLNK